MLKDSKWNKAKSLPDPAVVNAIPSNVNNKVTEQTFIIKSLLSGKQYVRNSKSSKIQFSRALIF